MSRRTERVGHVIQREISDFILREISDSRVGFVTLSRVEVSPDLGHAKVFVSVLGSEDEKLVSLETLAQHAPRMRTRLSKALHTRTVPRVVFSEDRNLEHGLRIAELLREVKEREGLMNDE
jgi:ribosome-binding factor A